MRTSPFAHGRWRCPACGFWRFAWDGGLYGCGRWQPDLTALLRACIWCDYEWLVQPRSER